MIKRGSQFRRGVHKLGRPEERLRVAPSPPPKADNDPWHPREPFVFKEPSADPVSVAVIVIGKNNEEIQWFKDHTPHAEQEARMVYVSNPGRKFGGTAAIANPFIEQATEDVVAIVHADTTFGPGALRVFAKTAVDYDCLAGIVGRARPDPSDRFSGYTWCTAQGGVVSTLDSCSVFFRRASSLRFDGEIFNDFHMVVEDLCMQGRAKGMRAIVPRTQADHVGNGGEANWNDGFWAYRAKLTTKYPGAEIHTV